MTFRPNFLTTLIGSFPHTDAVEVCQRIAAAIDIPTWPQMVRLGFRENMYTQYSAALPRTVLDEVNQKITFDTTGDFTPELETFYMKYLDEDFDAFGLTPEYAAGFYAMLDTLRATPGEWVKGQVTGPISFGLTVVDQDLRSVLYNELLADTIVKNMALNARWQIQQLRSVRPNIIMFVDEPYMASFGSAFISLSREQAIAMMDEVFEAIHAEDALTGVHCCANTDWSVLLATQLDILNLDAYGYLDNLALYPEELRKFLDRGGIVAWGIVPNNEDIHSVTPQGLADQLRAGLALICDKAAARGVSINPVEFESRSLITPACGLGSTTVAIADKVLEVLAQTGEVLRR
ncbi:MAG: methionine synthase [Chloroflexi bacterium]|nr:methionine synthase [Chloroflexota bacterium]MBU1662399.1 methionine synthase [Chloroflexota bacterium]